mgnify:FL=1
MIKVKITLLLILVKSICLGQNFHEQFNKAFQSKDTTEQIRILEKWEVKDSINPELYTSYFNYYFSKSQSEILLIGTEKQNGQFLELKDSNGNVAGFIGSKINYEQSNLKKCFEKINKGIEMFPNRLDMRFGKITALKRIGDWQSMTNEIISSIKQSKTNNNNWLWTGNEKKDEGKKFFLRAMHSYQLDLYYTENDDLLINMRTIGKEVIKHYPDHIESLSNIAITHLLFEEYDKALEYQLLAEKLDSSDTIVLNNIAQSYLRKGEKEKALEYLKKTLKFSEESRKNKIEEQIKKLEDSQN